MQREILLTGATGVLGSELVATLLRDPQTRLWLLIRARSDDELTRRLREVAAYACEGRASEGGERLRAVRGDVAQARLGMDTESYARVARATTHVIHAAADVRFDRSLDEAMRSVVGGMQEVVRLAQQPGPSGSAKKLEYVSTVGVAGRRTGLVLEESLPPAGHEFRNSYERAKAEAEHLLLAEMRNGLGATIHRPSMIVGDSLEGRVRSHQGFYFLVEYFLGLKGDTTLPDCGAILMDTVPVDYAANAIAHSTSSSESIGRILHLCSGQGASTIAQVINHARGLLLADGRELPPIEHIPLDRYREHLARRQAAGSRLHDMLAQFAPYFSDHIAFDNRQACRLFGAAGIQLPAAERYLTPVLRAYWASERGRRPKNEVASAM
jgi:thioester reductase-like protein